MADPTTSKQTASISQDTSDVSTLTTADVASLTTSVVAGLTSSDLSVLATSQLGGLSTDDTAGLATSDVAALSTAQVAGLTGNDAGAPAEAQTPTVAAGADSPATPATTSTVTQPAAASTDQTVETQAPAQSPAPAAAPTPTAASLQTSANVDDVVSGATATLLNTYAEIMSNPIQNDERLKKGAAILSNVVRRILERPSQKHFDVFFNFHVKHKDTLMSERYALRGMEHVDSGMRAKIEMIYALFRRKILGNKSPISVKNVQNVLKTNQVTTYLDSKK